MHEVYHAFRMTFVGIFLMHEVYHAFRMTFVGSIVYDESSIRRLIQSTKWLLGVITCITSFYQVHWKSH